MLLAEVEGGVWALRVLHSGEELCPDEESQAGSLTLDSRNLRDHTPEVTCQALQVPAEPQTGLPETMAIQSDLCVMCHNLL
jgi:hypothetical protein